VSEKESAGLLSGIDVPKVIGGTLAAVSAAVVGSFLGVGGTLAGAAIASLIGSLGTEIYTRPISRGAKRLQALAPAIVRAPAAVGTPPVAAATEEDSPSHLVPPAARQKVRWRRVILVAGGLFLLTMASLTVAELVTGGSVASTVGHSGGSRTTITGVLSGGGASPAPGGRPSATPTGTPTGTQPATTRSVQPSTQATTTASTGATTTAPTQTQAPQQAPPAAPHNEAPRTP
jgi:hypothetical protein